MNNLQPPSDFADLARRCLDGSAEDAEHAKLNALLVAQPELAAEFASLARFDAMLKQMCRREAMALLEFVALEAEMPTPIVAAKPAPLPLPASAPVAAPQRNLVAARWLQMAAIVLALIAIVSVWMKSSDSSESSIVANLPAPVSASVERDGKIVMLQPRTIPASSVHEIAATEPPPLNEPSLTRRLNDFYLPDVNIQKAKVREAMQHLTTQLREHNHAKRPELNDLKVTLPPASENLEVTLQSGPISFAKAVEVVAALSNTEAVIGANAIAFNPVPQPPLARRRVLMPNMTLAQGQHYLASLGIASKDVAFEAKPGGVDVTASEPHRRALVVMASAQDQLASLPPLRFIPFVVPTGSMGKERVLSAAEINFIRAQLAAATPGSLPVITLPFGGSSAATMNTSSGRTVTITGSPDGEGSRVIIDTGSNFLGSSMIANAPTVGPILYDPQGRVVPSTTAATVASTGQSTQVNLATNETAGAITVASSTASTVNLGTTSSSSAGVEAQVASNQGIAADVSDEDEIIYTPEGIPVLKSQAYLYGIVLTPTEPATGSTLVLVPAP